MHWLSNKILKHKSIVLICFLVMVLVSFVLSKSVVVNYQLMDYLPKNSPSTVALDVMNKAFDKAPPNARVLIKDITLPEALEYKNKLSLIDGVLEITWLDDTVNINEPIEMIEEKILNTWYKDKNALFSVLIADDKTEQTVKEIRELIGDKGAMSGAAVNASSAQEATGREVSVVMMFIVPIILFILLVTTSSWFEPVLFLISIGMAILINDGTNIIFSKISFITKTTSAVLQLAVSMDYSIFLLHRFAEFREQGQDVKSAMMMAMEKSFYSILSSGLTTVFGFAALMFMRFRLGPDMGIVLAKGILFSLLSVMFLLPVMTIFTYKIIDKTHHRSFLPSFKGLGKAVAKLMIPTLIIVSIMIVPAFMAQRNNNFIYGSSAMSSDENSQDFKEEKQIDTIFGKSNQMVMLVSSENPITEKELIAELYKLPEVSSVISYTKMVGTEIPKEFIPDSFIRGLMSKGYSRLILNINTSLESDEAFLAVEKIRSTAKKYYGDSYYFTGGSVNVYDMKETVVDDNIIVTIVSVIGIGLVILLTFRSISIPLILLTAIEASVWINLSFPYFTGSSMAYIGFMIISSVQLGATVDYAILFSNRYIENRTILEKRNAIIQTVADTTASILTSAGILTVAGLFLGWVSTNGVIGELGILLGRGAALSALMVLFLLPTILYMFDAILPKTTLGLKFYNSERNE